MGATNCPETPRQKMIQMLYLVYTAMLALNVSAEVLAGFTTVGDAMEKSNVSLQAKLDDSYAMFEHAYENNKEKTEAAWNKAKEVRAISQDLENYIDSLNCAFLCFLQGTVDIKTHDEEGNAYGVKIPIRDEAGNYLIDSARNAIRTYGLKVITKPDNNNDGTRFFLGESPETIDSTSEVPAMIMKNKIINYKKRVREILGDDADKIKIPLNVESKTWSDHNKQWAPWEVMNFDNTIAIADMVVLSRMRSEVMTVEYDVVNELYNQISANDFKFDKITYVTKPVGGSGYVMQGGKFETEVRIAAYDSKTPFTVSANGVTKQSDPKEGSVIISGNTSHVGENKITGKIYVKANGDQPQEYQFEEKYFVAAPAAVIELTNMNVVYVGIDNPVTITIPGMNNPKINVVVKEGTATFKPVGKDGEYIVTDIKMGKNIVFDVNVTMDGSVKTMGHGTFRVKPLPNANLTLGGKKGGAVTVAEINSYGLRVQYDENFTFKLPKEKLPKITNWTIGFKGGDEISGQGNIMNHPEVKERLNKARNGERVSVDAQVDYNDGKGARPAGASFRIKK